MMKLTTALAVALAGVTVAAYADPQVRTIVRSMAGDARIDADEDGWLNRAEAQTAIDRAFDALDGNDDGRLDDADHQARFERLDLEGANCTTNVEPSENPTPRSRERVERRVTVICTGERGGRSVDRQVTVLRGGELDEETRERIEREIERAERDAERAMERAESAVREAERHAERAEREAEAAGREAHSNVFVFRETDGVTIAPIPPIPAIPPIPRMPMFMSFGGTEEADSNGDGALSRDEFRAQQLRYFDASDANGDGRVRLPHHPPEPPAPPAPPTRR